MPPQFRLFRKLDAALVPRHACFFHEMLPHDARSSHPQFRPMWRMNQDFAAAGHADGHAKLQPFTADVHARTFVTSHVQMFHPQGFSNALLAQSIAPVVVQCALCMFAGSKRHCFTLQISGIQVFDIRFQVF